ncbi:MAG: cupin domain-containing protein [bacterium]|nr:cupin domain-containing protein [bacterium]
MIYKKKFFWNWKEHKPEEFPPKSAFKGLDIRYIITKDTVQNNNSTVFIRCIFPKGAIHGKHIHHNAEEVVYINKGYGLAWQNGEWHHMGPGDIQFIPKGEIHAFKNEGEEHVEMLCTYSGCNSLENSGYEEL